jgi:hypothetical protein
MEKWYKLKHWIYGKNDKWIEPIWVDKHTDNTVWIKGRMNRIRSDYENYFPTFDEAKSFCIARIERELEGIKNQLAGSEKDLESIKAEKDESRPQAR